MHHILEHMSIFVKGIAQINGRRVLAIGCSKKRVYNGTGSLAVCWWADLYWRANVGLELTWWQDSYVLCPVAEWRESAWNLRTG